MSGFLEHEGIRRGRTALECRKTEVMVHENISTAACWLMLDGNVELPALRHGSTRPR